MDSPSADDTLPPAPAPEPPAAAVILAAGRSSRMGTTKALLPWGPRCLLASWVLRFMELGVEPIAVVLGPDGALVQSAALADLPADAPVVWVANPQPDTTGPRESLLLGLDALPADRPAWFTPVDVPVVDAGALRAVAAGWGDALESREVEPLAAVPTFKGTGGHPVLAGPAFVARLFQGEPGDRIDELLAWATRRLVQVPVTTPRVLADMNTLADYHGAAPTGDVPPLPAGLRTE